MILNECILSYDNVIYTLDKLCEEYNNIIIKQKPIGYTTFHYPINYYTIGNGDKDVILIAATHGCELVTVTFLIEFIHNIVNYNDMYTKYLTEYTFHIIPILNPEGYVISSSNVIHNIRCMNINTLQTFCKKYLNLYEQDDINAEKNIKCNKLYKTLMTTSCEFIKNNDLICNIDKILKECNLDTKVLPVWQTNGMGIDINANSIHEFKNMKRFKDKSKFGKLRYNDIPVNKPSPHGFPGDKIFDKRCPENISLFNFVNSLYSKKNLKLFISYHSTGGEIYGYPDINLVSKKQYQTIVNGIDYYSFYSKYTPINEKDKYGVMDYYRTCLTDTVTLTVELSKINCNPIGPFSNIENLNKEFIDNINSIFYTLDHISLKS